MQKRFFLALSSVFFVSFFDSKGVFAQDIPLPPVNLGQTSFIDALTPPGVYLEQYFEYYHAPMFSDSGGGKVPGPNKLNSWVWLTHAAYISKVKLLGGYWGGEILLPFALIPPDTAFGLEGTQGGVGDVIVSPLILEWTDKRLYRSPLFVRFTLDAVFPSGSYDSQRSVNPGSNLYSINPYTSATLFLSPRLEMSIRFHYLWNSENKDPFYRLEAGDVQPGQAVFFNYGLSYKVVGEVRAGVNGYFLEQVSSDRIDGHKILDSKERVFAIGPGIMAPCRGTALFLNVNVETASRNRPEGVRVLFRVSKKF